MKEILISYLNKNDVEQLGEADLIIFNKPYFAIISCIVISIFLIVTQKVAILGIIILPLALLVLWKIPNRISLTFFEKFLVAYPVKQDDGQYQKIYYADVVDWNLRKGTTGGDVLILHLSNDDYVHIETFKAITVIKKLNIIMPEKELNKKTKREMKHTKFKFPWSKK
ncbi:MAG: hypothetical protein ACK5G7_02965 [Erysipelotrichaceae bacterium]